MNTNGDNMRHLTHFISMILISSVLIGLPSLIRGDTGKLNQLNPSVMHDDQFILYQSRDRVEEDDFFDIWRMDLVTKEREQLTYSEYDEIKPKINLDGTNILFTSFEPQKKSGLWLMNSNGSDLHKISPEEFNCENGAFHPIEKKIIYCSDENNSQGKYDIWEMDYDGTNRSMLISVEGRPLALSYRADGKQVVFDLLNIDGSYSIMLYDIPMEKFTEILSGRYLRNPEFYSNDMIYFLNSSDITMYNLSSSNQEGIRISNGVECFCFNSRKNQLFYSAPNGYGPVKVLWVMDIDGSNKGELIPSPAVGSGILKITWFDYFLFFLESLPFLIIISLTIWYFRFRKKRNMNHK